MLALAKYRARRKGTHGTPLHIKPIQRRCKTRMGHLIMMLIETETSSDLIGKCSFSRITRSASTRPASQHDGHGYLLRNSTKNVNEMSRRK
jgi:hypothetical protein